MKLKDIKENQVAKRCAIISITGSHSLTLIASKKSQAADFAKWLHKYYNLRIVLAQPCPCGEGYESVDIMFKTCKCSTNKINKHRQSKAFKSAMKTDIITEFLLPSKEEPRSQSMTKKEFDAKIKKMYKGEMFHVRQQKKPRYCIIDSAIKEFDWNENQYSRLLSIAEAISRIDDSSGMMRSAFFVEAMLYRGHMPKLYLQKK